MVREFVGNKAKRQNGRSQNGVISCSTDLIISDQNEEVKDEIPQTSVENNDNPEPFIPTHEWQVVKENQAIPAGLHVRMNFQTGIKEAKILEDDKKVKKQHDKDETIDNKVKVGNQENVEVKTPKIIISKESEPISAFEKSDDKVYFTKSDLKEALNEFRDKVGTKDVHEMHWSDDNHDDRQGDNHDDILSKVVPDASVRKKFRSIEEIRNELEDTMGWKIKTDIEIMKDHISVLTNDSKSDSEKATTLDNLEYYVHQIDNARDLDRVGGFQLVVMLLNHTNELLQQKAANVIGAAAQSNHAVQQAVLNHGGINFLLRMLVFGKEKLTKKKGIYGLSAVIRGNSKAQQEFVKLNGLQQILNVIKNDEFGSLRVKAVTLLFDLIVEQNEVMERLAEEGKKAKGELSPLLQLLLESEWCHIIMPLLQVDDYDTKEKVIQAIVVSIDACKREYEKDNDVIKLLKAQLLKLKEDISAEDDDDFKSYLLNLKEQLDEGIIKKILKH